MIVETFLRNEFRPALVQKLDLTFDRDKVVEEVWHIMRTENRLHDCPGMQLMLATVPNVENPSHYGCGTLEDRYAKESPVKSAEFTVFNPRYLNSYMHEIWKAIPYKIGRMTLMRLSQHNCISVSEGNCDRLVFAAWSSPNVFQLYENHSTWYEILPDNHVYLVDGKHRQTLFNGSNEPAIYLVFELLEQI